MKAKNKVQRDRRKGEGYGEYKKRVKRQGQGDMGVERGRGNGV